MTVSVFLTPEQLPFFREVVEAKKLAVQCRTNHITLDNDSVVKVLDALNAVHNKAFMVKNKSAFHMEKLFYLEQIITRIHNILAHFEGLVYPVPEDDVTDVIIGNDGTMTVIGNNPQADRLRASLTDGGGADSPSPSDDKASPDVEGSNE